MMNETKPVARWLRVWSVATLLCAAAVLILGALITTFRVGMSDPVWPTEPWYLIVNNEVWGNEPAPGFLIEHTHRLVAWAIGVFATVLAVGAWLATPERKLKLFGTVSILLLLFAYLALHGEMGAAWRARKTGGELQWPVRSIVPLVVTLGMTIVALCLALQSRNAGAWVRATATLALVAVMIQGLLGGYRVFLDQLMGTQLAAIHGSFGQVTFALLTCVVVLTARPRSLLPVKSNTHQTLTWLSVALVAMVVMQLIWGVWMRHMGAAMAQRLHLVSAFVVFALGLTLALKILSGGSELKPLRFSAFHLLLLFAVQIWLGVEAYMGKFAVTGAEAMLPVELRAVSSTSAVVRTAHTLIGAALLGSVVALAVRIVRLPRHEDMKRNNTHEVRQERVREELPELVLS